MIAGIGMDLVDIGKMARSIRSDAYLRRVFTAAEILDCGSGRRAAEQFAGKFASKEAFMKAIGQGIRQGIWFAQIEILHRDTGEPYLLAHGPAEQILRERGVEGVHLSISHTSGMAVALVILER